MPNLYSSYDLCKWKKAWQNGRVRTTKANSKPQTYIVTALPDSLEIIIHLSNFYHHRTGIHESILLERADQLVEQKDSVETTNLSLLLSLFTLAIVAGVVYLRSKHIALLVFVLLYVSWMLRSAFSYHYQILQLLYYNTWVIKQYAPFWKTK